MTVARVDLDTGEILADMTRDEARALTDRIRDAVEATWALLLEAHEQRAWAALGYGTWAEYVLPMGNISERAARDIKPHLDDVTAEIEERIADEPAVPSPERTRQIVSWERTGDSAGRADV